jgi:hypothetical protein
MTEEQALRNAQALVLNKPDVAALTDEQCLAIARAAFPRFRPSESDVPAKFVIGLIRAGRASQEARVAELVDEVDWLEKGNAEWKQMFNEANERVKQAELERDGYKHRLGEK